MIEEKNRFVLELTNQNPSQALNNLETIRRSLQNATNKIVLIESVTAGRILAADKILGYDETRTDVTFVIADQLQGYVLLEKDGTD